MTRLIFFSSAGIGLSGGKAPYIHNAVRIARSRAPLPGTWHTSDTCPLT